MAGRTPIATSTWAHSTRVPSESSRASTSPRPDTLAIVVPVRTTTPLARCSATSQAAARGPRMPCNGRGAASITVTSTPSARSGGCRLEPDQARADHGQRPAAGQHAPQPLRVGQRAQRLDVPVARERRQLAGVRARGDQQVVVTEALAAGQDDACAAADRACGPRRRGAAPRRGRRTSPRAGTRRLPCCPRAGPWTAAGGRRGGRARRRARSRGGRRRRRAAARSSAGPRGRRRR